MIVVVMGKRLEQQNTVETLNGDGDPLKKEGRFFVLSWDRRNASSKGVDEIIIIIILSSAFIIQGVDWRISYNKSLRHFITKARITHLFSGLYFLLIFMLIIMLRDRE